MIWFLIGAWIGFSLGALAATWAISNAQEGP